MIAPVTGLTIPCARRADPLWGHGFGGPGVEPCAQKCARLPCIRPLIPCPASDRFRLYEIGGSDGMGIQTKPRVGRPPRTDDPQRVLLVLPGELREWLRNRAGAEGRDQGGLVADALRMYREWVKRARKRP